MLVFCRIITDMCTVRKVGYYLPFVIVCGVLLTISAALMSTFEVDTTSGKWIGYQILGGFGQGLGLQMVGSLLSRTKSQRLT